MASGRFAPVTPDLARARQVSVLTGGAATAEEQVALSRAALAQAAAGRLRPVVGQVFPLAEAAAAHSAIEARATTGKTLLAVRQGLRVTITRPAGREAGFRPRPARDLFPQRRRPPGRRGSCLHVGQLHDALVEGR
jgi:hypothetical protein